MECSIVRGGGAALVVALLAVATAAAGEAEAEKQDANIAKATRSADSRFVHRIKLYDEAGNAITAASTAPYSPRQTCSTSNCHDVDVVNQGSHSRMFPAVDVVNQGFHSRMFPAAAPDPARAPAHVWTLFHDGTGVTAPLSHGFLAGGDVAFDAKMHLTTFELSKAFGQFHPGGGRFELDAEGQRYDQRMAEDAKLKDAETPDYYKARWADSGVLEHDCMACHAVGAYDHIERAAEIDKLNHRWAATVGAGYGTVEGRGDERKVTYDASLFDGHGKVLVDVGRPPDRNCLACHRRPASAQAKGVHAPTWRDGLDADVHSLSGLSCVDCHTCEADHVMFGDRSAGAEGEWASLTCQGCHDAGRLGSPIPAHAGLPRLHLERIACETCHSGPRPRAAPLRLEQPGKLAWNVPQKSSSPLGPTVWAPVVRRGEDGVVRAYLRMLPAFYAAHTESGALVALEPSKLRSRFRRAKGLEDDDGDGVKEVSTEAEIQAVLEALRSRYKGITYLCGGMAYALDAEGKLTKEANPLADPIDLKLAHNVRPADQALGAEGCAECHASDAPFFNVLAVTRALGADGKPEGQPMYALIGRRDGDLLLADFREQWLRPYAPWVLALSVLAMLLHYVLFGPHRARLDGETVQRFHWLERLTHFGLLGSFVVLATTGLWIAGGGEQVLGLELGWLHRAVSWVLAGSLVLAVVQWARDMVFAKVDIGWVKVLGGYLGYHGRVPAGRFNAGQKFFFWAIGAVVGCLAVTGWLLMYSDSAGTYVLVYTLHELCAWVMILFAVGHAYLGSLANPGTLRAVFEGKVTRDWLALHHPDYEVKDSS